MIEDPSKAPELYKDLVRERYIITKHTNTSYSDTADISYAERNYLIQFIAEDLQRKKEMYDEAKEQMENKK